MAYIAVSRTPIHVRQTGGGVDPGYGVEGPIDPGFGVMAIPISGRLIPVSELDCRRLPHTRCHQRRDVPITGCLPTR
jgi:hypothetical protein